MKLPILASVAMVLLAAIPGVFSEEPSSAVAEPIESFTAVIDAIKDADLFDDEDAFDEEEGEVSTAKKSRSSKSRRRKSRSSRRRRRRRRSSRSNRRRRRSRRSRRRTRRGMCGRNMRRGDRPTCRTLERRFCRNSRDRRRNRRVCSELGFPTAEFENNPETYLKVDEVWSEDTLDEIDMIVEDVEDELYEDGELSDSEDYDDEE